MNLTYEELLECNIDEAIKLIGEDHREFKTTQERLHAYDNNPAKIPNNPLLVDYDWVYEHVEELFCQCKMYYQAYQPTEAYYTLFKALTTKYSLDKDYDELLYTNKIKLDWKWGFFSLNLIDFMTYSFDDRLKELLSKPDVLNYFLKYPEIYDIENLNHFSSEGLEIFLKQPRFASHYTNNPYELIQLIRKNLRITIPAEVMLDENVIKTLSRTHHIEEFYYYLHFVREQVADLPFLEEHAQFCDKQVENIKNGILPCYQEKYKKSKKEISIEDIQYFNYMEQQVIERVFKRSTLETLPKKYIFQELSRYMIIGMFISRNYQTDPYNLLIDIETLHEFANQENRQLQGQDVYQFLVSFEDKSLKETIEFYNQGKNLPLMEILYDDWSKEKDSFIEELNSKIYTPENSTSITKDNLTYYDITDIEEPIIVHNTTIPIKNKEKIAEAIKNIKQGHKIDICLSIQDQNHNTFYEEYETKNKNTLKLAYGPLVPNRVGTICHTDAYSQGINDIEIDNNEFKRRLYTVKSFMDKTTDYNEMVYLVCGIPTPPIGIICEDQITPEEQSIAKELNIPIFYRKTKQSTRRPYKKENLPKIYTYTKTKYMF